ncbi:hypothetical protein [Pseudomonas nicosulfuronedens]
MFEFPAVIARELARLQFTCLDEAWVNRSTLYRFQCAKGHVLTCRIGALTKLPGCRLCHTAERIQALQEITEQDGALCLDLAKPWNGDLSLYHFHCRREPSHEWSRRYSDAALDSSCPHCVREGVAPGSALGDGLQRLKNLAQQLGGECLASHYQGANQNYRFRCKAGHCWVMSARVLLTEQGWCPTCQDDGQQGLGEARQLAQSRGGEFLSTQCRNVWTMYLWRCAQGHTWPASLAAIRGGMWCQQCTDVEVGLCLEGLHQAAERKGGKCLTHAYTKAGDYYRWQCAKGHTWRAKYSSIRQGAWCQQCFQDSLRLTLEEMQQVAAARGGQCLASGYQRNDIHYEWRCAEGHVWSASFRVVRKGSWCPVCRLPSAAQVGSWAAGRARRISVPLPPLRSPRPE